MTDNSPTTLKSLERRIHQLEAENSRLLNLLNSDSGSNPLSSAEPDLQSLLDHMPAMIGYWGLDLRNRFGNRAYFDWFGVDPSDMPGMHIRDVIGEENYRLNLPHIEAVLRGERQLFERAFPSPDGNKTRHSLTHYIPDSGGGQVRGFYVLVTDISAIKAAEEALRQSEALYREVVEDQTEVISRFLPDGTFTFVNDVFCKLFKKTATELVGHRWNQKVAHPDDVPMIEARLTEITPTNPVAIIENRILLANGEIRWMQFVNRGFFDAYGNLMETQSVGRDITERKMAEEALRNNEHRLRAFLENSAVIGWLKDEEGRYVFLSKNYERRFDVMPDQWLGKTDFELWPREIAETFRRNDLAVLNSDQSLEVIEYTIDTKAAKTWWLNRKFIFHDVNGQCLIGGLGVDITDRIHAEENLRILNATLERQAHALKVSEERLELALAGSELVLWDWLIEERKVTGGNRLYDLLGYSNKELGNEEDDWMALINPRDLERFSQKMSAHLLGETACFENQHQLRHKDGHWVSVEARGKVTLRDQDNTPLRMVGTLLDITQRKRLNEEGMDLLKKIETLIRENASPSPAKSEQQHAVKSLTKRQRQILGLIAAGMTSAEIGKRLHLSTATVITHRRNLMAKLDLHSTAEVTRYAIHHGLLVSE